MASGSKADLARAGTMEVTSKEGRAFLEKNLTEWKKPLLIGENEEETSKAAADKKPKKATFKEPDVDDEDDDSPKAKKAKLAKATTMDLTAEEGKQLLRGEKLGDTRLVTNAKKAKEAKGKGAVKRATTMQKVVAEADAYGYGSTSGKRKAAARPAAAAKSSKKPAAKKAAVKKGGLKKTGTMVKTAKEGKQLIGKEQLGDTRLVTKQKQKKQK